ncbi:MAG TPA: transposase, partial [Candidatus Tectomicrobia bacterium]|nr:transposase [Candidatus Tectomicrobia bacterium]
QTQMAQVQRQSEPLQHQVEPLQGRLAQPSQTSSKPPSSEAPFNKPTRHRKTSTSKRGGQTGHRGNGPTLLRPTEVHLSAPGPWPCGQGNVIALSPSHTHQVSELPPIEMEIHQVVLPQGHGQGGGRQLKAPGPSPEQAGSGPPLSARIGALAGLHRPSWRLVQACCHSVCHIPLSLGAVPKVLNRGSQAIVPHYEAMATLAHQAPVGSMEETPWYGQNALPWLWIRATATVTYYRIDPPRATAAFWALIDAWPGLLGSDGYGVSQDWVNQRHPCLAPLIRTARGLSQRRDPASSACGTAALRALQRLCPLAPEPPTGGQWPAWYARFCRLRGRYQERADEAGRLVRRLARERTSLWGFLRAQGGEPTNNRAERGLRCGVMWRQTSHGTDSAQGNRWVERSLSLRQTCRQLGPSPGGILVDAVPSLFQGHQPDLAWLYCHPSHTAPCTL